MNEMEAKGVSSSGVTVVGSDDPTSYHISPRAENDAARLTGEAAAPADAQPPVTVLKKKRGRPRKHGPDGPATAKPISVSSPPAVIDFSAQKRPKLKPTSALIKQHQSKFEPQNSVFAGEWASSTVGTNFTPHVINVNRGEDVTMKVISFAQQGPRAICILSANGIISSVALCQPDSFGGTLTYEGCFEILSLTGSFMPSESGGIKNRSGGMSVSLSSPDGRVFGGGVAGLLVAATSVQIVVGSFLAGNQLDQKPKKQKSEFITSKSSTANVGVPVSSSAEFVKNDYGSHGFQTSGGTITYSFQEETRNGLDDNENTLHEDC